MTKRNIRLAMTVLCFCALANKANAQFDGGTGTQTDPYQIATPAQLAQLATYVNANNATYNDKYYILTADIDLDVAPYNTGAGWTPIGKSETSFGHFKGHFNGSGKKVTNLYITNSYGDDAGLFGYVNLCTIENLGIENVNVTAPGWYVGSVVGTASNSVISNCYSTGTVSGQFGTVTIGGVAGYLLDNCTISNCYFTGTVTVIGASLNNSCTGGVVGCVDNHCIVSNCYSTGTVTHTNATSNSNCGGVVGMLYDVSAIYNCYSTSEVSGNNRVGGIIGEVALSCTVSNCAALNPAVKGTTDIGRVIGKISSSILTNNIAFEGMLNNADTAVWSNIGANNLSGEDISKKYIYDNPTLERFASPVWTSKKGYLPGLFGNTVEMPEHLRLEGYPFIAPITLPNGIVGTPYNETLAADGNDITWTTASGDLPDGLDLSISGVISGTPAVKGVFHFTVKASNEVGEDTLNLSITITEEDDDDTRIVETQCIASLRVYPNPVNYELRIMNYEGEEIQIFNIMGQALLSFKPLPSLEPVIDVTSLNSGMYFLKIGNKTVKIIKN